MIVGAGVRIVILWRAVLEMELAQRLLHVESRIRRVLFRKDRLVVIFTLKMVSRIF